MAKRQQKREPLEAPQIWDAYRALKAQQGTPPSVRAMAGWLGVGPSTLYQRMRALARRGEEMPPIRQAISRAAPAPTAAPPSAASPSGRLSVEPPPLQELVPSNPEHRGFAAHIRGATQTIAVLAAALGAESITVTREGAVTINR